MADRLKQAQGALRILQKMNDDGLSFAAAVDAVLGPGAYKRLTDQLRADPALAGDVDVSALIATKH